MSLQDFEPGMRLRPVERALVEAIEAGEDFLVGEKAARGMVRGGLIRAVLLGIPVLRHPLDAGLTPPRAVRVTPHGIRLKPAKPSADGPRLRIAGTLDLGGLAAPGGGYLPPLEFSRCRFDRPIRLAGTHLQGLVLDDSRFSELHAQDAHIGGTVRIGRCGPLAMPLDASEAFFRSSDFAAFKHESAARRKGRTHDYVGGVPATAPAVAGCPCPPCAKGADEEGARGGCENPQLCCVVDFAYAKIGGALIIERTYLRAAGIVGRSCGTSELRERNAANLSHVAVRGSIAILNCTFLGAVMARSADIDHDLWVGGGKFFVTASRPAFDLQSARIQGQLAFQSGPPPGSAFVDVRALPVLMIGQIWGIGLSAGEVWIGEGLYWGEDPEGEGAFPTLYFAKADIARTFKIGAYHDYHVLRSDPPTQGATVQGEICLLAANLGKNLEIHGCKPIGLVHRAQLRHPFFKALGVTATRRPIMRLTATGLRIDRKVTITHSFFVDQPRSPISTPAGSAQGPQSGTGKAAAIDLWRSTIGIGFHLAKSCRCRGAIRLNSCLIGRQVFIQCSVIAPSPGLLHAPAESPSAIPWLLDLRESTVNGHLKIGRKIADRAAIRIGGGISLENAKVQGRTLLRGVRLDLRRVRNPAKETSERDMVALNLRDFECGSDFEVERLAWRLPPPSPSVDLPVATDRSLTDRLLPRLWKRAFARITDGWHAYVDLRGLRCGVLHDRYGEDWGLLYRLRLRLAGIRIGGVEAGSSLKIVSRLRWLGFQSAIQRISDQPLEHPQDEPEKMGLRRRLSWFRETLYRSAEEDFSAESYDVFSAACRRSGEAGAAEEILIERKNIENALRYKRVKAWMATGWARALVIACLCAPLVLVALGAYLQTAAIAAFLALLLAAWPMTALLFQMGVLRAGLRYGLSPDRALLVLVACICIGWVAVHYARNGAWFPDGRDEMNARVALVLDVPYAPAQQPEGHSAPEPTRAERTVLYGRPSPCDLDVSSLLYAMDVFLPVVDLDQERRCSIRHSASPDYDTYFWWRFAKSVYQIIGWIISSLVVLTVTGVLRRDLEPRESPHGEGLEA